MGAHIPSKLEIIQSLAVLGSKVFPLLMASDRQKNAGELRAAAASFQQLVEVAREEIRLIDLNNQHYPDTPMDVAPVVGILLNAQLTWADVVQALGDMEQAEALRREAMTLADQRLSGTGAAERHRQRAQSLLAQSRYPEALVALYAARDEFKAHAAVLQVADVTQNLAGVLEWLADYSRALAAAEEAAQLIEPLLAGAEPSMREVAEALAAEQWQGAEQRAKLLEVWLSLEQIVARVNRQLGRLEEAEAHFRKVLPRVPEGSRPGIEFQLEVIQIARGRCEQGLRGLQQLEPWFVGLARPKLGVLQSYKAEALLGLGRVEEARQEAESSVKELSSYHDTDALWKAQWRLARVLTRAGQEPAALAVYEKAAGVIDALRKAPLGYRLDSTYMAEKLPLFEEAIELAGQQQEAPVACRLIELVKSRALTATLSAPRQEGDEAEGVLAQQVEALSRQLDALEYSAYCGGSSEQMEQTRAQLLQQRFLLLEQIRFSDPRWRSLSAPPPFDVGQVLEVLARRNQSALTLFCTPRQVVSVLLRDGACHTGCRPLSEETAASLARYRANLQSHRFVPGDFDPAAHAGLAADDLVPKELLAQAVQSSSLLVVPHGPLHLLPWAGMMFDGERLFQRCPVSILPNLTCAVALHCTPSERPRVALVGAPAYGDAKGLPDLPSSEEELATVADLYGARGGVVGKPLVGAAATEEAFWGLTREKQASDAILHMACHGGFETGEPMNSGLMLADGKVDAAEIARQRLPFSEVILSACFSGYRPTEAQGVALSGDDVLGLPGAFLEAGARAVLVSITPARDDAALELMTQYHEQRTRGVAPLLALQMAQKGIAENPLYPACLWVGFTLYGCQ